MTEYDEQQTVFDYAHGYASNLDERLKFLHPVENTKGAGRGPAGYQYTAGVPDAFLPVAIQPFHGLYIELKTRTGKLSPKQIAWHRALRANGYAVQVCYGAEEAIETLQQYLAGEYPPF